MPNGFKHSDETKARIGAASRARGSAKIASEANAKRIAERRASLPPKPVRIKLTEEERRAKAVKRAAEWAAKNPERAKEIKRKSYEKHYERMKAKQLERNRTPERREFMRQYAAQHRAENPGLYLAYSNNRRALKIEAPGEHSHEEWIALVAYFGEACAYCGNKDALTRDHVIPLSRTELRPTNDIDNILPACKSCNSQKGTRTDWEYRLWMAQTGRGRKCL